MKKSKLFLLFVLLAIAILSLVIYFQFFHHTTDDEVWKATVVDDISSNQNNNTFHIDFSSLEKKNHKNYTLYQTKYPDFFRVEFEKNHLQILVKDSAVDILLTSKMKIKANQFYSVDGISKNIASVFILPFESTDFFPIMVLKFEDETIGFINLKTAFETGSFTYAKDIQTGFPIQTVVNVTVTENDKSSIGIIALGTKNELFEITDEVLDI